jgi:hypothetical protein
MTRHDNLPDDTVDVTPIGDAQLDRAGALLRGALPATSFAPGFADRTMARLATQRATAAPAVQRVMAMQRNFRLLAAAAALAIVALGVNNVWVSRGENTTVVEAAVGLEPVSAESVLAYESESVQ